MTLSEAKKLDAEGRLHRKVMTEKGWYVPRQVGKQTATIAVAEPTPSVFRRRTSKIEEPI